MQDDVIINKITVIKNCLKRIEEEYVNFKDELEKNYTRQDSIVLNLQRACEASIDLGSHIVKLKDLGVPQSNRDIFVILEKNNILITKTAKNMQNMVGFRNISIHNYQGLNIEILQSILNHHLDDFMCFIEEIKALRKT